MQCVTKNKMKVDILIPNFDDLGAQRVAINAANGLKQEGYDVRFVVTAATGPFRGYLDPSIEVLDLGTTVPNIPKVRLFLWVFSYVRLAPVEVPSTLISFAPIMNLFVIIAKLFNRNRKIIIQEHAFQSVALKDRSSHSFLFEFLYRNILAKLYPFADIFLTISEAIRKDYVNNFRISLSRTHVIQNPVDTLGIVSLAFEEVDDFKFENHKKYLIGVGRLTGQKIGRASCRERV